MPNLTRKPADAPLQRMQPLARLPIFLDLAGKTALVAGGSAAAAWKAELLAAAGADVHIYAASPDADMASLVERGSAAGQLTLHRQAWTADAIRGAAIAIADAADDDEAHAFYGAAVAAKVPVNIIDKPDFCQFQFGSIVNRSPVVVAISTSGAAPVLAQAIRRRIETLLPPAISGWGRLAAGIRDQVTRCLPPGFRRRQFWERFATQAFNGPPPAIPTALQSLHQTVDDAVARSGHVTLVGAGPGDAELLNLKAVRAMQSADVILFDDLVSGDVLELARREAKRIMVGKRGRRDSCRQQDITELAITLARQGKHVVRLKSGDPMIFGRAGEEISDIKAAGIGVTVVPGVTAGLALASSLSATLTSRACANSVRFVTGHAYHGGLPDNLDWDGLADRNTTLVVYMAGKTAAQFAANLMTAGLAPQTPAVAVANVSRHDEQQWAGSLARLAEGTSLLGDGGPIIVGIGAVFADVAAERARPPENAVAADLPAAGITSRAAV